MNLRRESFLTTADNDIVREIKEVHGFVSLDPRREAAEASGESQYTLSDGTTIVIGKEAYLCNEVGFNM